jgi:glycerol kinase
MAKVESADELIVAIDQGTSSTKVIVVNSVGQIVARASVPVGQTYPRPGWVEQNADEIYSSVLTAVAGATAGLAAQVVAIGISAQRESAVCWDRASGKALGPVIGWQDRRTADVARQLAEKSAMVRASTGLPIDPMFSALKFGWLLDHVDKDRSRSLAGEIALGTVDSWLLHRLTGEHRIEIGNASRTQLLNLDSGDWDESLLELFHIPRQTLPRIVSSIERSAPVTGLGGISADVRVTAVLGDSHAALYGHGIREPGEVKVTYGTGSSIMGLLSGGNVADPGLVRTIAWSKGTVVHAFEGNILSSGATLIWLAEVLSLSPEQLIALAEQTEDALGVTIVPAFAGLGAPWWDDDARAIIVGLDLSSTAGVLARAAVESIPLQVEDVLIAAEPWAGGRITTILADGGPSSNSWLMQLQSDLSQRRVVPSAVAELSALGVAHLAGEAAGLWSDSQVLGFRAASPMLSPQLGAELARERRTSWLSAVARARSIRPQTASRADQLTT